MAFEPVRVGVLGLGDISDVYLRMIERSPALHLTGVSSLRPDHAAAVAQRLQCQSFAPADLMARDDIEVVVNLTPATAHDDLNAAILRSGKHLYSEKPLALSSARAAALARVARDRSLQVGSAPDTFFGAAHQHARTMLDSGVIGTPLFGTAFMGHAGVEMLHPRPEAFYRPGGELPFDMGPYYVAQWINLLGPVRRVAAGASGTGKPRTIRTGPLAGKSFQVTVPTTYQCLLEFDRVSVSLTLSLDTVVHRRRHMELYGERGLLSLANPDFFGGDVSVDDAEGSRTIATDVLFLGAPNRVTRSGRSIADYRGVGLVDLAVALRIGVAPRASLALSMHTVEVLEAIRDAAHHHDTKTILSHCERPFPIGEREGDDLLVDLIRSPFGD